MSIPGPLARRQVMPLEIASGLLFALLLLLSAARWLAGIAESLAGASD